MEVMVVRLPNAKTVQAFAHRLAGLDGEFELVQDGFILDARSLMGIFSLDLSRPILLRTQGDAATASAAAQALKQFAAGPGEAGAAKDKMGGE